jgi:hypothetical protein
VNQGPVPMHEQLRTELRNFELKRSSKTETCFWCDSKNVTMALLRLLTTGNDGNKEGIQQHRREIESTVSTPVGKLRATINAGREHPLAEFCFACVISTVVASGRACALLHSCEPYQSLPLLCVTLAAAFRGGSIDF